MPRGGVEERATVEGCRSELGKVERQIDSTVNTIADGMYHSSMKLKMDSLEDWKAKLIEPLANPEEPPTLLHPNMVEIYRSRSSLRMPDLIRVRMRSSCHAPLLRCMSDMMRDCGLPSPSPDRGRGGCHATERHSAVKRQAVRIPTVAGPAGSGRGASVR